MNNTTNGLNRGNMDSIGNIGGINGISGITGVGSGINNSGIGSSIGRAHTTSPTANNNSSTECYTNTR